VIDRIALTMRPTIPGIADPKFQEITRQAMPL